MKRQTLRKVSFLLILILILLTYPDAGLAEVSLSLTKAELAVKGDLSGSISLILTGIRLEQVQ